MVLLDPWFSVGDGFTPLGELMLSVDIFDCHSYWHLIVRVQEYILTT